MSVIDHAKKHWDDLARSPLKSIDVEEWLDYQGNPTTIYFRSSMTHRQVKIISSGDIVDTVLLTVIARALDADGNQLFTMDDVAVFDESIDPEVVAKICIAMGEVDKLSSVDDAKKK